MRTEVSSYHKDDESDSISLFFMFWDIFGLSPVLKCILNWDSQNNSFGYYTTIYTYHFKIWHSSLIFPWPELGTLHKYSLLAIKEKQRGLRLRANLGPSTRYVTITRLFCVFVRVIKCAFLSHIKTMVKQLEIFLQEKKSRCVKFNLWLRLSSIWYKKEKHNRALSLGGVGAKE